jgi:hypothetical protein
MQEKRRVDKSGCAYEATDLVVVPSEEATMLRDAPYVAHTTYDRDNPETKGGSTFVDKDAFLLVINQDIGQSVQIHSVIGKFMQRNFLAVLLSWYIHVYDYFFVSYDAYCPPNFCILRLFPDCL